LRKIILISLFTILSAFIRLDFRSSQAIERVDSYTAAAPAGVFARVGNIGSQNPALLLFSHDRVLYASVQEDEQGIFRSSDLGRTWTPIPDGIPILPFIGRLVASRASIGNELFVGGTGVYRLNTRGDGWVPSNNGLPANAGFPPSVLEMTAGGPTLFANIFSGRISGSQLIYRSRNLGQNWELAPGFSMQGFRRPLMAATISTLIVATERGVFRSTDQGDSFTAANVGLEGISGNVSQLIVSGEDFYAAIPRNGIFRSSNQGMSWSKVSSLGEQGDGSRNFITALMAVGPNLLATVNAQLYLSIDRGSQFTLIDAGAAISGGTPSTFGNLAVIGNQIFTIGYSQAKSGEVFAGTGFLLPAATVASAASFDASSIAPNSIIAVFGSGLATATQTAEALPLPLQLAGTTVVIKDAREIEYPAPLFYVSPRQLNCLVPADAAIGPATFKITSGDGAITMGGTSLHAVSPGIFTANSDGFGAPAALAYRYRNGQLESIESVVQPDGQGRLIRKAISLGSNEEQVFLVLYGTGIRGFSSLQNIRATIGGSTTFATFAGAQGGFSGLDQVNLALPRSLAGRGDTELFLSVDTLRSNVVKIRIE
jgi:uncharacterized protein (TIGR03437 family)